MDELSLVPASSSLSLSERWQGSNNLRLAVILSLLLESLPLHTGEVGWSGREKTSILTQVLAVVELSNGVCIMALSHRKMD